MDDFRKDAAAITIGAFLGALIAHSLGSMWYVGVFTGGAIGYLARLALEPQRVVDSFYGAWDAIGGIDSGLAKRRALEGFYSGAAFGSVWGSAVAGGVVLLDLIITRGGMSLDFAYGSRMLLYIEIMMTSALGMCAVGVILACCFKMPLSGGADPDVQKARELFFMFNPVSLHYMMAKSVWKNTPTFIRAFIRFVHSDVFTACGVYASIGAAAIFFLVPRQPFLMLAAAIVCGAIGARGRKVVLGLVTVRSS